MSLKVAVGTSQQMVSGIHQETSVQDVVRWLCERNALNGRHFLMEVWRGCSHPLEPRDKLLESISHWGEESRHVTLKLAEDFHSHKQKTRQRKARRCKIGFHSSKINCKHLSKRNWKCTKALIERRLKITIKKSTRNLEELRIQTRDQEDITVEKKAEVEMVSFLNPYLQGEYISSRSDVSKAKQMKKDLYKHRKELEQNISNRQSEILSLETNVDGTQEKVGRQTERE